MAAKKRAPAKKPGPKRTPGRSRSVSDEKLMEAVFAGGTRADQAKAAGLSRSQFCKRIMDPKFQAALSQEKARLRAFVSARLAAKASKAIDTLDLGMDDKRSKTAVAAARAVLDFNKSYTDSDDFEDRLRSVESRLEERANSGSASPAG